MKFHLNSCSWQAHKRAHTLRLYARHAQTLWLGGILRTPLCFFNCNTQASNDRSHRFTNFSIPRELISRTSPYHRTPQEDMARAQREVLVLVSTLKARHDEAGGAARERRELEQAALSVGARERNAGATVIGCVCLRAFLFVCVCARARACMCVCVCVRVLLPSSPSSLFFLTSAPSSIPPSTSSLR